MDRAALEQAALEKMASMPKREVAATPKLDRAALEKMALEKLSRSPGQSLSDLPKDNGAINEGQSAQDQPAAQEQGGGLLDRAQTQLEALGNTIGMGYLAHMQAAHEKFMMPNPNADTDEKLKAQGFKIEDPSYVQMRDENLQRQAGQAERNPYDAAAGMVGGMAVTAPLITAGSTMAGAGKALTTAGRIKDSAALGLTMGAASNPGDTQGVVDPLQGKERLSNAGTGGTIGAGGQVAGEVIGKVGEAVKNSPKVLDAFSKNAAFKATGAMLKDFRAAFGRNSSEEIGGTLLKRGIVKAGDTFDDIAAKAATAKQETGKAIGDTYKKVEASIAEAKQAGKLTRAQQRLIDASEFDGAKMAKTAKGLIAKGSRNDIANSKITGKVQDAMEVLESRGKDLTMQDLVEMKSSLDGEINYARKMGENPANQQHLKVLRDVLNKNMEDKVRVSGKIIKNDSLIDNLKVLKKEYGHLATTEKTATDRVSRESANKFFGLTAHIDGAAGTVIGASTGDSIEDKVKNGLYGFAAGKLANKSSKYAMPLAARGAKALGEALQKPANLAKYGQPLIEAAKKSPQEFQALLNQFGKDPEFIRLAHPAGAK